MLKARRNVVKFEVLVAVTKLRGLVKMYCFGVNCCLNLRGR
jgi:hypothetical protein